MGAVLAIARIVKEHTVRTIELCLPNLSHTEYEPVMIEASSCNNPMNALEWRREHVLDCIIEVLSFPDTHTIGVYGSNDTVKANLLEKVTRRVQRDNLFDVIMKVIVTKKSDVKKIQEDIADGLNFKLDEKSIDKRASLLHERIKREHKILVILCDLCKGIDLGKVGIPSRTDHSGCKLLLTSNSEEVLSNQMHTQKKFHSLILSSATNLVETYFQCLICYVKVLNLYFFSNFFPDMLIVIIF